MSVRPPLPVSMSTPSCTPCSPCRRRRSFAEVLVLVDPAEPEAWRALSDREAVEARRLLEVLLAALAVGERESEILLRVDVAEIGGEAEVRDGLQTCKREGELARAEAEGGSEGGGASGPSAWTCRRPNRSGTTRRSRGVRGRAHSAGEGTELARATSASCDETRSGNAPWRPWCWLRPRRACARRRRHDQDRRRPTRLPSGGSGSRAAR